jgi:pyruvate dehydrogenase E1 component alpha subunit
MPGIIVDGQDVDVVYREVSSALDRAKAGEGPSLLEMTTYRYRGHSRTDPAKYRAPGELEEWKKRDPIDILGARLAEEGLLSTEAQQQVRETAQAEIDAAAERAAQSPVLTLEETRQYVYAD